MGRDMPDLRLARDLGSNGALAMREMRIVPAAATHADADHLGQRNVDGHFVVVNMLNGEGWFIPCKVDFVRTFIGQMADAFGLVVDIQTKPPGE